MFIRSRNIYQAARLFADGKPLKSIKELLLKCPDFDEDSFEEIISLSQSYTSEVDGGYSAFIKAVNKVLGEKNAYCVSCSNIKKKRFSFFRNRHIRN